MEKTVIIVPTYWKKGEIKEHEQLYDHPADLLSKNETLSRTLESFNIIHGNFDVLTIGIATNDEIGIEMDGHLSSILKSSNFNFNLYYFGHLDFLKLKERIQKTSEESYWEILSNKGYGNVRNLCIFLSHILGYSICVLIDDDEIITDSNFLFKIIRAFEEQEKANKVGLVLGYYLNEDNSLLLPENNPPFWMAYWDKIKFMNDAFKLILNSQDRYIEPPFALGGNMSIHRNCWTKVPFDPIIPRGEDMDYLRNCIYFGFRPILDTKLSIIHLSPKSNEKSDHKFHQDIFRFVYSKYKLQSMDMDIEQFDPYPGYFLRDTEGKAYVTELLRFIFNKPEKFLTIKNEQDFKELLTSEHFITTEAINFALKNKKSYLQFQEKWALFLQQISSINLQDVVRKI
ncbi:MAG: hypothetical protein ACTSR2_02040 [Candidatus Hodarchaeales archaeon]